MTAAVDAWVAEDPTVCDICGRDACEEHLPSEAPPPTSDADSGRVVQPRRLDEILDAVTSFIRRFVVVTEHQATVVALWAAHTHAIDAFDCTPYLQISSATKRAGKTRLLEVLEPLVARPWFTGRTSPAALVRKVDAECPTLLLDESDASFNGDKDYAEALRGLLNTGYRRSGTSTICVGQGSKFEARSFRTFNPKAIAGIGQLPDTVADRSIAIELRRRKADEPVERWRERDGHRAAAPMRDALAVEMAGRIDDLREARPTLPDYLSDRQADVWEPLLAIADAAGIAWAMLAREAAKVLSGSAVESDITIELLTDLRAIFSVLDEAGVAAEVLATTDLIDKLVAIEDGAWATWRKGGQPITGRGLARLLKPLRIFADRHPTPTGRLRGYRRDAFDDAIARYLSIQVSKCPETNETSPEHAISTCPPAAGVDTAKRAETPIDAGDGTHGHLDRTERRDGGEPVLF